MRFSFLLYTFFTLIFILGSCSSKEEVSSYAATETYPNDIILNSVTSKKGMIIIAHDDDMSLMAGTLAGLHSKNWNLRVISVGQTPNRNAAHIEACKNIVDSVLFFNFSHKDFRKDILTTKELYAPIAKDSFNYVFNYEPVANEIIERVNNFNPSVIFTADNEIGGTGHPEHVFLSQLVLDLISKGSIAPQYVYQSVYTDHMEETIMDRYSKRMKSWGFPGDTWEVAKKKYEVEGMPEPNFQIRISNQGEEKMNYLRSYDERERKTMDLFIPAFAEYDADEYFQIFDREFFRLIEVKSNFEL